MENIRASIGSLATHARLLSVLAILSPAAPALAQPSAFQLDAAFTASLQFHQTAWPTRATSGPSGKAYVTFSNGSRLSGVNGQRRGAVIRLNADGTLDSGFNVGAQFTDAWALVEQSNGQVLVGAEDANESAESGQPLYRVFRLAATGARDASYRSPVFTGIPRFMTLQPDGKLLVAHQGGTANGGLEGLQRLNSDGSLDTSFSSPLLPTGSVIFSNTVVDASGRILIAGTFGAIGGQSRPGVARLNANGSLDTSFVPSGFTLSQTGQIRGVALQSSGKIVVAGGVLRTTGTTINRPLLRLNTDGTLDSTFTLVQNADAGIISVRPRGLVVLPNDKLLVVSSGVARFDADGSLDTAYAKPVFSLETFWMDALADGRVIVPLTAGSTVNGAATAQQVMRFNADGSIDAAFAPGTFQREIYPGEAAPLADGRFIAWGDFDRVGTTARIGAARFNADGTLDGSYSLTGIANFLGIIGAGVLSDGRLLAAVKSGTDPVASFTASIARFAADGAVDKSFNPDASVVSAQGEDWFGMRVLPDDKTLAWSLSPQKVIDGTMFFKRLGVDGALDPSFAGLTGASAQYGAVFRDSAGAISSLTMGAFDVLGRYPDGRLIAAATKGPYAQNAASLNVTLLRFNADGTLDGSFAAPSVSVTTNQSFTATIPQYPLTSILSLPFSGVSPQADGSVIVYGTFTALGGQAAPGIARLTSAGAVDPTFSVGSGAELRGATGRSAKVMHFATDAAGRYWVTGLFDTFGGKSAPGIARLNPDGSVDTAFSAPVAYRSYLGGSTRTVFDAAGRAMLLGSYEPGADGFPDAIHRLVPQPVIGNPAQPVAPPPVEQTVYTASAGKMPAAAVAVEATGTLGSATVNVALDLNKILAASFAAAEYNVYVAALVPGRQLGTLNNTVFVKAAGKGWLPLTLPVAAYLQNAGVGSADQKIVIEIVRDTNLSTLIGTEIYVGYGTSDTEMLAAGRYRGVYKVQ